MNTREGFIIGGEFGPAVEPGDSSESLLVELITSDDPDDRMPPKGKRLTPEQKVILQAWIDAGLPWEAGAAQPPVWKTPLRRLP